MKAHRAKKQNVPIGCGQAPHALQEQSFDLRHLISCGLILCFHTCWFLLWFFSVHLHVLSPLLSWSQLFSSILTCCFLISCLFFSDRINFSQLISSHLLSSFQLLSFFISTLFISSHPFALPLISSHLYNLNLSQPYCSDFHFSDRHSRDDHWSDSYCSDLQISVIRKYRLLNVLWLIMVFS